MTTKIIVIGGGGHSRCVIETAQLAGFQVIGFTDFHAPAKITTVPYLGADDALAAFPLIGVVLGVGCIKADKIRTALVQKINIDRWTSVIHPSAIVSGSALIADGAVVFANSIINAGSTIGAHAIVNCAAMIDHDCKVGAFTHVAPGAIMGGGSKIGCRSMVGIGAKLRDHVTVGDDCTIGMSATVLHDFADGKTIIGTPARELT